MYILLNNYCIFPIKDIVYDDTPAAIFSAIYQRRDIYLSMSFERWLYDYINPHLREVDPKKQKDELSAFLNSKEKMRVATLGLFPTQYKFTNKNWPYIKTDMRQYKINKHKMLISDKIVNFETMRSYCLKSINQPIFI